MTDKTEEKETSEGEMQAEANDNGSKAQYENFEQFLATVDEGVKELYNSHTAGLKKALDEEREGRRSIAEQAKQLAGQVKELMPKAEKGSELESKLGETLKQLEDAEMRYLETQKRAGFTEQAITPEIGCSNIKAAYAIATSENLFNDKGQADWAMLKKLAPELFKVVPVTNAGVQTKVLNNEINSQLRKAAGF